MTKLLTFWAAYRLLRALTAMLVIATLALLLLSSARRTAGQSGGADAHLQHAARPLERQLQHALQKALGP